VDYYADIAVQILFLIMLGASLNLLMGYAGELSMAHATFYGVGAYTAGLLTLPVATEAIAAASSRGVAGGAGWDIGPALLVAIGVSFVVALLLALPALSRVRGEYLVLLTLAFQTVANQLMGSADSVTGGAYGLTPIPPAELFGLSLGVPTQAFWLLLPCALIVVAVCFGIGESPFGRLLKGLREQELAVKAVGKDTVVPKLVVFGLAAGIAGFAGALNASYYQFIAPGTYDLNLSILVIAIVIIGGVSNLTGTIVGAILLGSLRPILQEVAGDNAIAWQAVVYGLLLVLIIRFRPLGLVPEGTSILRLFRRRPLEPAIAGASSGTAGPAAASIPEPPAAPAPAPTSSASSDTTALVVPERPVVADGSPVLEVRNLSKRFRGLQAVDDVSFDLERGKITALIGPNGAGKTTIFNLLTRVITPDTGTVTLNGEDISALSPHRIAKRGMARSFQDGRLFERLTAVENVMLAVPGNSGENLALLATRPLHCRTRDREARELALEALGFVGMREKAGITVADLSFGDQKLVAIARLLATECDVLLLDEPTSGVDPGAVEGVIDVVRGLRDAGKTVCLVEHSVHMVGQLADRGIFLDQGRKLAEGTLDELMGQKHLTEIYFGA
jgi:branched-chain amino acid transport system permease protein